MRKSRFGWELLRRFVRRVRAGHTNAPEACR
jgi:hypothetical protein